MRPAEGLELLLRELRRGNPVIILAIPVSLEAEIPIRLGANLAF